MGYGDGMCCAYGTGGYKLYWDDEFVAEGGEFTDSEEVEFACNEPAPTPSAPAPTAPVPLPTNAPPTEYVKLSAFQVKQKERANGKLKTFLRFAVRNQDGEKIVGAAITTKVTYTASDGSTETEEDECDTNDRAKCAIKLVAYDPASFSSVTVEVLDVVKVGEGAYNAAKNVEQDGCAVFSAYCSTLELGADA